MKKLSSAQNQSARNTLSENLALSYALPVGLLTAVIWWFILHQFHTNIPIVGWPSVGGAVLINASIITFFGFLVGYLRGLKAQQPDQKLQLSKPKLIFDALTLAIAYTIIMVVISAVAIYGLSEAFKGLILPLTSSALVIGIFATITLYAIITTSVHLQSRDIVNALTIFIAGGVLISMITAQNPLWWEINFSSLGTTTSLSSATFNITLILSGLLLLSLTDYLLNDLGIVVSGEKETAKTRTTIIRGLFIFISLSLAGVGLFPWNRYPLLHNTSAYLLIVGFAAIIIGLRWLVPSIGKSFLANSYVILAILLSCFALWRPIHYFSQTAFELIAFSLTFVWLVLFLRTITLMRDQVLANRA